MKALAVKKKEPLFWLVWKEKSNSPVHKHFDEGVAIGEAERLAKENIGYKFYVCSANYGYIAKSYVEKFEEDV